MEHEEFLKRLAARREVVGIPKRPRLKQNRLYIDNEYFELGYAAIFPNSVTLVYCILAKYANARSQICWPSVRTIMRETGIGSDKTVFAAVRQLEFCRLIKVSHSRGRSSNRYQLSYPMYSKILSLMK